MCCGRGTRTGLGQVATRTDRRFVESAAPGVRFMYTGRTALMATGAGTGRLYRFEGSGAILAVDRRDAYGLGTIPALHRVGDENG